MTILVIADPDYVHSQDASGKFNIKIPLLGTDATYRIKYIVDKLIVDDQIATVRNGHVDLKPVAWVAPVENSGLSRLPTKKEVSDEELRKLSIPN
jgi:hypothetical protein